PDGCTAGQDSFAGKALAVHATRTPQKIRRLPLIRPSSEQAEPADLRSSVRPLPPVMGDGSERTTVIEMSRAPAGLEFAERQLWNIWSESRGSLRLETQRLDHLGPFLGFVGDELAKIGGRARKRRAAEVGEPRFHVGVCEGRVDLPVELVDDLDGCAFWRAHAVPTARLRGRHKFPHNRNLRQPP